MSQPAAVEKKREPAPTEASARTVAALRTGHVEVYTAEWCGWCRTLEAYLDENGIRFVKRDIDKSPEAKRDYQALGGRGLPLTRIGERLVRGFKPEKIQEALLAESI